MKKIVVLGGGESGVGTAILAKKKEYAVFVSDKGTIADKYKKVLLHNDILFEEGKHTESKIFEADIVMKSPGIPDKVALVQELLNRKIPVVSEIEFASQFTDAMLIGITGSNGKTTTTMLTNHVLKKAELHVGMAGNIGDSFALQVANENYDKYVLELSSFQLDGIIDFAPHVAVITNISPDHLDRYDYKYENYINSKFRITMNQTADDYLIYDADDEAIENWLKNNKTKAQLLPFSLERSFEKGAYIKKNNIIININSNIFTMSIAALALQGKHNTKNAMASTMIAKLLGVRNNTLRESLEDFDSVEHRLEPVLKINGVHYINDSKATNVNAAYYALDSVRTPIVWIVGGTDKGNDYTSLLPLVREKVKAIICLGLDNSKIIETFGNVVDFMIETAGAEEAVKVAYKVSEKGDTVLLAPACASFDLFENYEDRGRQFKDAVRQL
ncbi:UDP-N-acetylmuramoyl-L-alanine--D-glutamate ligase [Aureibaculum sp. 2210JD6-5]|uniref:UDP-N-acetylmuramoyl-L-alanine--D-glutamate ligase n=1 Tax=Aureibaculum sp. 2210JD6-5 TaxID=3103957 RepID=UPI002AACC35B|nr:UDP-N-acetylmuramoyl-L-alanine--D-glutamate ligase [Aureibaculum sp. 2210JD6-5]MDY7394526.1 UDP-N-acetylmuramoyl-L-alanine--D-glutamate ligase [Aureibaculum sp. 2210JD6-5]